MSSKFLIFVSFIFLSSCGVKSNPIAPDNSILPSFPDQFIQTEEIKKKKKK